jgi:hypothetical protein
MTRTIIIRDDDISYFTRPEMLEAAYGRLWAANIPVCFATIPAQRDDARVLQHDDKPIDPSIPPQYRGKGERHPITGNPALCDYLTAKVRQGLVEIALHGYDHAYHEFGGDDADDLQGRITEGHALLASALPDAAINTFIAPYDRLSHTALTLLIDAGYHISTKTSAVQGYAAMPNYSYRTLPTGKTLFASDEYCFHRYYPPEVCLAMARRVLHENALVILTNHYWTFYYDWQQQPTGLMAVWQTFVDELLALPDAHFTTFSGMATLKSS